MSIFVFDFLVNMNEWSKEADLRPAGILPRGFKPHRMHCTDFIFYFFTSLFDSLMNRSIHYTLHTAVILYSTFVVIMFLSTVYGNSSVSPSGIVAHDHMIMHEGHRHRSLTLSPFPC